MLNLTPTGKKRIVTSASAVGLMSVWALGWAVETGEPGAAPTDANPIFGPRWGRPDMLERMTRHLDLSAEQRVRIEAILSESRIAGEALTAELQGMRKDLQAAVTAEEFYEDQVRILIESKTPAMVDMMVLGAKTMNSVRAELTPEQRAKAEGMMEGFRARGRGGRHGFFGRRGGS